MAIFSYQMRGWRVPGDPTVTIVDDCEHVRVKRADLEDALKSAFDKGWAGTPEIAEGVVHAIVADLEEKSMQASYAPGFPAAVGDAAHGYPSSCERSEELIKYKLLHENTFGMWDKGWATADG